jgi:hypothetical protein
MDARISALESGQISPTEFVAAAFTDGHRSESSAPQAALDLLTHRSRGLEHELRAAVCANSDELLQNATDVKYLRDHVVGLKHQITRVRSDAQKVASRLLEPFTTIQTASRQLQNGYAVCQLLRVLSRFLYLHRQLSKKSVPLKLTATSHDVKMYCEVKQIAEQGELAGIAAFENAWGKIKPSCEQLVALAERQFVDCVEKADLSGTIGAAFVFVSLGTIERYAARIFENHLNEAGLTTRTNLQKCSSENVAAVFQGEFTGLTTCLTRLSVLYQALGQFSESEPKLPFDIAAFSTTAALKSYSGRLKTLIVALCRQNPPLATALTNGLPEIRRKLFEALARLPPAVEREVAFAAVAEAFDDFTKPFLSQTKQQLQKKMFDLFKGDAATVDASQISLFFEQTETKLGAWDRELLERFRRKVLRLAAEIKRLQSHSNAALRQKAKHANAEFAAVFRTLVRILFGAEAAAEIDAL